MGERLLPAAQRGEPSCLSHGDILVICYSPSMQLQREEEARDDARCPRPSRSRRRRCCVRSRRSPRPTGLLPDEVEPYGRFKAKIDLGVLERLAGRPDAKLIDVTAITPTKAGEGKTTTAVSLTQGLGHIGTSPVLCLREASLGPVFGIKGGAAGGGYAQVVPMEDLNLHFTGDIHAIGAANNLLAAMLEAHILHGNALGHRPALDRLAPLRRHQRPRAARHVDRASAAGRTATSRQTGLDITAGSEVMAIVAVASDLQDLRRRLGAITVAKPSRASRSPPSRCGRPARWRCCSRTAIKPNLVQTLEGQPALVHCGPFANIAHGNNSLVADRVALKLGDYVVTESGFGSDMGMEKFFDIVCRAGGLRPSAVVLVATVKALKHHGGDPDGGLEAVERGAANLRRHLEIVRGFGLNAVVAVNRFPGDTDEEVEARPPAGARARRLRGRAERGFEEGGDGAAALAEAVVAAADSRQLPLRLRARRADRGEDRGDRDDGLRRRRRSSSCGPRRKDRAVHAGRPRPAADLHGEDAPLALRTTPRWRTRRRGSR